MCTLSYVWLLADPLAHGPPGSSGHNRLAGKSAGVGCHLLLQGSPYPVDPGSLVSPVLAGGLFPTASDVANSLCCLINFSFFKHVDTFLVFVGSSSDLCGFYFNLRKSVQSQCSVSHLNFLTMFLCFYFLDLEFYSTFSFMCKVLCEEGIYRFPSNGQ